MNRWLPRPRFLTRDALVIGASSILVVVLSLTFEPKRPPGFDEAVLSWLGDHLHGPIGDALLQVYRLSGVGFTAMLVLAALIFLVLRRRWNDLRLLVMASGGILAVIDLWLKPWFDRARPHEKLLDVDGRSFPSGHAAGSVAFYFAMVLILSASRPQRQRPLTLLACGWVVLVWLSTLYARAHWPSDLLAGGAVGAACLTVCLAFWRPGRDLAGQAGRAAPPQPSSQPPA
jgi:undecaprenyl-diphosphatase